MIALISDGELKWRLCTTYRMDPERFSLTSETPGREHQLREQVREGRLLRHTSSTRLRVGLDTTLQLTSKTSANTHYGTDPHHTFHLNADLDSTHPL
jgi:hypothetical protein